MVVLKALVVVASVGPEVLDRQVADPHVPRLVGECVVVLMPSVEDGAGRPDERGAGGRIDLRVAAGAQRVDTGRKPVGRLRPAEVYRRVAARWHRDGSAGSLLRPVAQDR